MKQLYRKSHENKTMRQDHISFNWIRNSTYFSYLQNWGIKWLMGFPIFFTSEWEMDTQRTAQVHEALLILGCAQSGILIRNEGKLFVHRAWWLIRTHLSLPVWCIDDKNVLSACAHKPITAYGAWVLIYAWCTKLLFQEMNRVWPWEPNLVIKNLESGGLRPHTRKPNPSLARVGLEV